MKQFASWLIAALLAMPILTAEAQQKSTIIQKIIVKVNGEIFTQTDLEEQQILALREQNRQVRPQDLQDDATLKAALAKITPEVLVDAVDELLIIQRARETGARFTDENFKGAIENLKKANKMDDATFERALQGEGMTLAELRDNFEKRYLVEVVQRQEIMQNMTLTEQEARQYYAAHPEQFMKPASVTVREIFVEVPTSTGADGQPVVNAAANEAAQEKINGARERLLKGEDFAKVAGEVSESGTKANGGLIGTVLLADLDPSLAAVFDKLKAGEPSEPVRTARGYQIFRVDARSVPEPEPFDQVRDEISQRIYEQRLEGEMKKYLDKLRDVALIEWKDPAYKQLYDQRRAELAAGKG